MLEEEETRKRNGKAEKSRTSILTRDEVRDIIRPKNRIREYWSPLCPSDGRNCRPQILIPQKGLKRIAWPPPPEDNEDYIESSPVQSKKLENNQIPNPNYQPPRVVFEPPPSYITLRSEAPISQSPPPIYQAQPAATLAPTSGNMRGDTKWPPESVKQQTEAENRARVDLAKGPAFRPRRVAKDYTSFFAQHALNSNYPGYRAPPGTQYFTPAYQQ